MYNSMKAFEYAKEITVACATTAKTGFSKDDGEFVADFFEAVFKKLVELEDEARKPKND